MEETHPTHFAQGCRMAKPFKILLVILGLLVTLVVVAAIGLVVTFDPNDYRDDIEQVVEEATGRDLTMSGPLSLSIFPWLGVETEDVALGNAEGFGNEPFAQIGYFGVSVRLLPLLEKRIEIGTVRLDGMRLNLARDESGTTNWDDLIEAFSSEDAEAQEAPEEPPATTENGFAITDLSVEAVEIEDAKAGLFTLHLGGRRISCRESLSDLTSAVSMSRCDDKSLTSRLLANGGLLVPAQAVVREDQAAVALPSRRLARTRSQ